MKVFTRIIIIRKKYRKKVLGEGSGGNDHCISEAHIYGFDKVTVFMYKCIYLIIFNVVVKHPLFKHNSLECRRFFLSFS